MNKRVVIKNIDTLLLPIHNEWIKERNKSNLASKVSKREYDLCDIINLLEQAREQIEHLH